MRTHPLRNMLVAMGIALALLVLTIALGRSPKLGLDLQGGVSVNLQPVKDGEVTDDVDAEDLDEAIGIIRKRVDAVGVAEPEVSRQGNTITVQLPGATNQQDVLDLVGKTAELRFRPVLEFVGPEPTAEERTQLQADIDRLTAELGLPEGVTASDIADEEVAAAGAAAGATDPNNPGGGAVPGGDVPVDTTPGGADPAAGGTATEGGAEPSAPTTAAPGTTADPTAGNEQSAGNGGSRNATARFQDDPTATTVPGAQTTTTVPFVPQNSYGIDPTTPEFQELLAAERRLSSNVTDPADDKAENEVVLVDTDGNAYRLGPTLLTGSAVEDATAGLNEQGEWVVNPVFRDGPDGIDLFNQAASACFNGDPTCPAQQGGKGQLAIVLDGEILTAPSINEATFARDSIQISGSFDQDSARDVAVALRFGSLPVQFEPQQAETVSATLGEGALRAGIIAGLIGLVAVFAYLFLYYRMLALITLASLSTSAMLLWVAMSWLGATVTLAGVVGLVVSIGIAIDSSVVSFEGIKEDVRAGATVRSVTERSMTRSYSTIVKADTASLIGAAVLYWLSVGPVRGFAFYLGAATLLDLFSAYFVLRPGVMALSRSGSGSAPQRLGIPIDDLPETTRQKVAMVPATTAESVTVEA